MKFIRQLCGDEYSLHEYGATRFLDSFNAVYGREGIERALRYRATFGEATRELESRTTSEEQQSNPNEPVF